MHSLVLQPTPENLINSFVSDSIGRSNDICMFANMLMSLEDISSIGLDGKWGSGKTFFIKQSKMLIDSLNPNIDYYNTDEANQIRSYYSKIRDNTSILSDKPLLSVYYDAWEHDNEDDPILSLIYEISKEFIYKMDNKRSWIEILEGITNLVTNIDLSEFIKTIKGEDALQQQKENESLHHRIEQYFKLLLPEMGDRLIIFVDEMDRCSPQYAVKFLERVKHYFSCPNISFVFSVNFLELENSIKHFYGEGIDACKYLDKFFDIRIGLTPINMEKYNQNLGVDKNGNLRKSVTCEMIKQLNMEMRDASKYILLTNLAAKKYTEDNKTNPAYYPYDDLYWLGYCVIVPIAIGLKLSNSKEYYDFMEGNDSKWLERILLTESHKKWVGRILLNDNESFNDDPQYKNINIVDRIREVYNAIFIDSKNYLYTQPIIGRLVIKEGFYYSLTKAIGLMSNFTQFD